MSDLFSSEGSVAAHSEPFELAGVWYDPRIPILEWQTRCMDLSKPVLREKFTRMQQDGTVGISANAGGLLSDMFGDLDLILQAFPTITKVSIYTHELCGLVTKAQEALTGQSQPSPNLEHLVHHLRWRMRAHPELSQYYMPAVGIFSSEVTLEVMESFNTTSKKPILDPLAVKYKNRGLEIEPGELIKVKNTTEPATGPETSVLIFTSPTNCATPEQIAQMALGEDAPFRRLYLIQRPSALASIADMDVAHSLLQSAMAEGKKVELKLVSLGHGQDEKVKGDLDMFAFMAERDGNHFLNGMDRTHVTFQEGLENLRRVQAAPEAVRQRVRRS